MNARLWLATLGMLAAGAGCTGPTGPAGPAGPSGDAGPPGNPGVAQIQVPSNTQAPTSAGSAIWAALVPQVTVQSVTIQGAPRVTFKVTDATTGATITGLGNTSKSSTATVAGLTNLAFSLAKLVPGDTSNNHNVPSRWVSYMVTTVPTTTAAAAPSRPTTDNTGTLVDNGDGTYVYTFYRDVTQIKAQVAGMTVSPPNVTADLDDLTYEPGFVHRLTIQLSGSAPGTGTNTPDATQKVPGVVMAHPADAIHDFLPSSGQAVTSSGRDIVATANCDGCHRQLGGIAGGNPDSSAAGFHGGNRNDARYCVVCHTEQRKYGRTNTGFDATLKFTSSSTYRVYDRAIGNFPNQIHHIHAGPVLALQGYNYADVEFNETLYPQDLRNCTKCHDSTNTATPQADNWKNAPSRLACGGCHDGIDFATGKGVTLADAAKGLTETTTFNGFAHGGFQQPDDTQCKQCHSDLRVDIDTAHLPVTPPSPDNALVAGGTNANTNSAWIASNPARLPAGAIAVSYDIKSVSRNPSKQPVIVFRMLQNGARKDLNDFNNTAANPETGTKEIWDNFMGSPSLYFVFAVPQDGIATPADFNASVSGYLRNIWNGTASGSGKGTLAGPDGDGYYTGTLTGVTIPDSAVMLTGGLGYSYNVTSTLPLTQTNLDKYPVAPSTSGQANFQGGLIVIAPDAQKVATGFKPRRAIVEDARCNACHQELGTFTRDAFHAGQRNDGTTCSWCHNPNRASSGWSADSVYFVHAIHAGAKRTEPFTWHAEAVGESFAKVGYPGVLSDCQTCHLPGGYDFSSADAQAAIPFRLYRTVATGAFNGNVGQTITSFGPAPNCANQTQVGGATDVSVYSLSPYIAPATPGTADPWYGIGFAFNPSATATTNTCDQTTNIANGPGGTVQATGASLVNSPVAGVCVSCHDSTADLAHYDANGGSIYKPRSIALGTTETCLICHGPGRVADINVVHAQSP